MLSGAPAAAGGAMPRRLLIDVTRLLDSGLHSGIQRVVRGLYRGALTRGWRHGVSVHAVRCSGSQWLDVGPLPAHPLELPAAAASTAAAAAAPRRVLQPCRGDRLLLADASWYGEPWPAVDALQRAGGQVLGFVHDLLPLKQPGWFRAGVGARFQQHFEQLLARSEHLYTSSEHVRSQLQALAVPLPPLHCLPLAAELPAPGPLPPALRLPGPWFLCVATLEPRKQHALLLDAMQHYWARGGAGALLLVGAAGWRNARLLARLRGHPEWGRRLQWLQQVNDPALAALYQRATASLYLSRDEGFGLPVLEAHAAGCPVIASDIPPLREAGGCWPRFIDPTRPDALLAALEAPPPRRCAPGFSRSWDAAAHTLLKSAFAVSPCSPLETATP